MVDRSDDSPESALALRGPDHVAAAAKAVLGAAPFVGSLFGELVGVVLPNQRIDRIVKFSAELENRLAFLEKRAKEELETDEYFSELLEEGLHQAARSLSRERRQQIASLIANSLSAESISHEESRHLMRILGELNDIEIIWLQHFKSPHSENSGTFRDKHKEILSPLSHAFGQPQEKTDKAALQDSYKQHLVQLGLLSARTTQSMSGSERVQHVITALGRLLLRQITTDEEVGRCP